MKTRSRTKQQCVIPRLDRGIRGTLNTLDSRLCGNGSRWGYISGFLCNSGKNTGLLFVIAFLACPSGAAAHLVTTGMGPVYDGIGHLLLTPEDLVPVLALALYAGMRGVIAGRRAMFLLPAAWLIGGIAGQAVNISAALPIPAISFLVLGGLVAADLCLPAAAVTGLVIAVGLVHGFLNGAALKDAAGTAGLIGIMTILFVLVTLTSAFVISLKKPWARIAVRVSGSWIAATGLLMFGWAMR